MLPLVKKQFIFGLNPSFIDENTSQFPQTYTMDCTTDILIFDKDEKISSICVGYIAFYIIIACKGLVSLMRGGWMGPETF